MYSLLYVDKAEIRSQESYTICAWRPNKNHSVVFELNVFILPIYRQHESEFVVYNYVRSYPLQNPLSIPFQEDWLRTKEHKALRSNKQTYFRITILVGIAQSLHWVWVICPLHTDVRGINYWSTLIYTSDYWFELNSVFLVLSDILFFLLYL